MAQPKFSILIPTRDRPDTFRHTLQSVLNQAGDDFEIVVADNYSGPATADIVNEAESPRIKYFRTNEILPMTDNWELGLNNALANTSPFLAMMMDCYQVHLKAPACF